MKSRECLQMKSGNCGGCSILELVVNRAYVKQETLQIAAEKIAHDYCPSQAQLQIRYIQEPNHNIGQFVKQPGVIYDRRES